MARRKLTTILLCLTVVGATATVAPPAHAADTADPSLPCEAFRPPYDYPCGVAQATVDFVWGQAGGAGQFVDDVVDDADAIADAVYHTASCTVNPDDPDCA